MSLRMFQSVVRKSARLLYTDPLIHLIVDFVIKFHVAESFTFAIKHQLEGKNKQVQAALNQLRDHGILSVIEQKTESFKTEYAKKLELAEEEFKNSGKISHIYYFNTDLKFIMKARLHLLGKEFEHQIQEARQHGHKYKCNHCADGDENVYSEVKANSMQMKCSNCRNELDIVEEENKLSEDDQRKCRDAIESTQKQVRLFDNYVVPANFFGPGNLAAYVSPLTTQHVEDLSNVHFDLRMGNEFHGFIRKRKVPKNVDKQLLLAQAEYMKDEINFYFAKEAQKRRRTN